MGATAQLLGLSEARQPWFYGTMAAVALLFVLLNVLVLVGVHGRRIRQSVRTRREKRFRARFEQVLDELQAQADERRTDWLRANVRRFDELERPIAP
jgi:hypothetical protein